MILFVYVKDLLALLDVARCTGDLMSPTKRGKCTDLLDVPKH